MPRPCRRPSPRRAVPAMSSSPATPENLEIMKEAEKRLGDEPTHKAKFAMRSPSKEEADKDGEEPGVRQEAQVGLVGQGQCSIPYLSLVSGAEPSPSHGEEAATGFAG